MKTTKKRSKRGPRHQDPQAELSDAELEQASGGVASVAPGALTAVPAAGDVAGAAPTAASNALAELQRNMSNVSTMSETISSLMKAQHEIAASSIKNLKG